MSKRINFLTCIVSGLLLIIIFPTFSFHYCAWFAFIPLLWCIKRNTDTSTCFLLGWCTGIVFFIGLLYWLIATITNFGNIHLLLSIPIFLLLCAYLGSYFGIFAALIHYLQKHKIPIYLSAPIIWTGLEFIRGRLLSGFPWGSLGYSQSSNLVLIQIVDILGVHGLSFIIILINCFILFLLETLFLSERNNSSTREILHYAAIIFILLSMVLLYGKHRIKKIGSDNSSEQSLAIGLIQPNIPQDAKLKEYMKYTILDVLKRLSTEACVANPPDIIVWPETAYTSYFFPLHDPIYKKISAIAGEISMYLLSGAARIEYEEECIKAYNSAVYFSPDGELLDIYNKIHLVPFGEYFPLPFIKKILGIACDISPGSHYTLFSFHDYSFGVVICFEAIFPSLCRKFMLHGAQFLITITNDAWFGNTAAPYQHFQMILFRAIENRTWLMRAANTGISGIISPIGKVMKQSNVFTQEIIKDTFILANRKSFYTVHGDFFTVICLFLGLILLITPQLFLK